MTRAIRGLLVRAANDALNNGGVVSADIAMDLTSEGYDTQKLDGDVERILTQAGHG